MSGGNMMSGDRLTELDQYKLDILKKITPSFGQASTPVDLFDEDIPTAFSIKIKKPFAEWTVAAFFNPSLKDAVRKTFPVQRLWLSADKKYLAFDFWNQQFVGEVTNEIDITIPPGGVKLLALHEFSGIPQLLSTDRHVLQGAVEIEDLRWNKDTTILTGLAVGPPGTSHKVYVYIPEAHDWTWGGYVLFQDYTSYTLKLVHKNVVQIHVRFGDDGRVQWNINVDKFFKQ